LKKNSKKRNQTLLGMKRLKNGKSSLGPKATVPHKAQTKSNKKTSSKKKYLGKKEQKATCSWQEASEKRKSKN
jgi:hypothetical protein